MDAETQTYVDGIASAHRPLFDRLARLILEAYPEAGPVLSYGLPTFRVGSRKLHVGVWRHGVSIYGWGKDRDAGFASRHPNLLSGRATIRIRPRDADDLTDDELREFVRAALEA